MTDSVIAPNGAGTRHSTFATKFERLRERAHEQIAALSVAVAQLERLRAEIERHLPTQRSGRSQ